MAGGKPITLLQVTLKRSGVAIRKLWPGRWKSGVRGVRGTRAGICAPSLSPICGSRTYFPQGRRETRFRLLWVCSVVKMFCSLSSLRGLVYFGEDKVFVVSCLLFVDATFPISTVWP